MLKLHGKLPVLNSITKGSYLVTVTKSATLPQVLRSQRALIGHPEDVEKATKPF